jgi:hypothetical protein
LPKVDVSVAKPVTRSERLSSTLPSLKYPVSMITDDLFSGLV